VKQHLAAIRMLFDWMVTGGVLPFNPAASVRGPKYSIKKGKTPVLSPEDARALLDSIDVGELSGLRDRALIAVMIYSFARVSAVVAMNVEDFYQQGKRCWLRLQEKGGKQHEVPAHHKAEEYLDAYLAAAGIEKQKGSPLWRSLTKERTLGKGRLNRVDVYRMIQRRIRYAELKARAGCHTFRATGITAYLLNGGTIENAQAIAAHESPRTTKLYDRTSDEITLDEVERIVI
jgi:integrase/recombinase XerD